MSTTSNPHPLAKGRLLACSSLVFQQPLYQKTRIIFRSPLRIRAGPRLQSLGSSEIQSHHQRFTTEKPRATTKQVLAKASTIT